MTYLTAARFAEAGAMLNALLPYLQMLPVAAFLWLAWSLRRSFWRGWKGEPQLLDIYEIPIFFVSIDIAYNVGLSVGFRIIEPPDTIWEALGRLMGITLHCLIAFKFWEAHRAMRARSPE